MPATGSISGMFGGIALGGLALGGLGGGSAGILSGVASSSSLLGGRLVNGYISGAGSIRIRMAMVSTMWTSHLQPRQQTDPMS